MTSPGSAPARLVDHPDFRQLVTAVADDLGLLPAWVEKDYWVVRARCCIGAQAVWSDLGCPWT